MIGQIPHASTGLPGNDTGSGERTLVVSPTYNERENIESFVGAVLAVAPVDVLIVDDSSPDGTGVIADWLAARDERVYVIHREGKLGLGTAYVEGFRFALERGYEKVVQMDADFSHRPEDLPRLVSAARNADLVIGSRNIPGGRVEDWSALRRFISRGGSLYTRVILGTPVRDCTSGFKCFRREALATLDLSGITSNGYGFQVEMNHLCRLAGLRVIEVPIVFPDRAKGESKMSLSIFLEAAGLVWRLRSGKTATHRAAISPAEAVMENPSPLPEASGS